MTAQPPRASELAARLVEVAERLDRVDIVPYGFDVGRVSITVHLANENDVDRAADLFTDTESAAPDGTNYTRVGFFDSAVTVRLFSGRTRPRCACGRACAHQAVTS